MFAAPFPIGGPIAYGGDLPWNYPEVLDYWDARVGVTAAATRVSAWAPVYKGTHTLLQATWANQPVWDSAAGTVAGDGAAYFMKAAAFTLNQPCAVLAVVKQNTYTADRYLWDGEGPNNCGIRQNTASPRVRMNAGSEGPLSAAGTPALGAFAVLAAVYNGASSSFQVNLGTPVTGDVGANNMSGFTIFSRADGTLFWDGVAKAYALLNSAPAAARLNQIVASMMALYGVSA